MIDKIIRLIFSFKKLRLAIFDEVDLYNSITRTLEDPYYGSTALAVWCEDDGWRGWTKTDEGYLFIDYPETSLYNIFSELELRDSGLVDKE
jgi:hypothetical protein